MVKSMVQSSTLISPEELPIWVPGTVTCSSDSFDWKGVSQRSYHYHGQDVEIPPMDSFMIVRFRQGDTPMDRQFDGKWTRTRCQPGHFSLLSRAVESHWHWTSDVQVSHVYLDENLISRVASDMLDKEVESVRLHDVLSGSDPMVNRLVDEITLEACEHNPSGSLYVEALGIQLVVHLLRDYASFTYRQKNTPGCLTQRQVTMLEEYIDAHLHENITLDTLAKQLHMGVWTFSRQMQKTFGLTPHALIMQKRIERTKQMLENQNLALKQIAASCGFSDQPHMTRAFRRHTGITPGAYRSAL